MRGEKGMSEKWGRKSDEWKVKREKWGGKSEKGKGRRRIAIIPYLPMFDTRCQATL